MFLDGKPLDDWTEDDLRSLIGREPEKKTLEFKKELHVSTDEDRREFLADVSSFANASGGYLIYGMAEDQGLAVDLPGISLIDPDAEVLRLESIVRDGMKPRIPAISTRGISLVNTNHALVLHIPASWASPHMVTFKNLSRFYSRTSAGKYQLDVDEIRAAFLFSETLGEKIQGFRLERISKIRLGDTPVPMKGGENGIKVVLHSIPVAAFGAANVVDMKQAYELCSIYSRQMISRQMIGNAMLQLYNFDGLVNYLDDRRYFQLFRNGIVEVVDADYRKNGTLGFNYEYRAAKYLQTALSLQQSLMVDPPIVIFLSLLGLKGCKILTIAPFSEEDASLIDRDALLLPNVELDSYSQASSLPMILKPAFDAVANAGGYAGSPNYDEQGEWIQPREQ